MNLLLTIVCGAFILFGFANLFAPGKGAFLAGIVCIGSGVYGYDVKSFAPLLIGFGLLWVLRLFGLENK